MVGAEERAWALAATLERDGHVARVVCQHLLGEQLGALDHVAIVCWMSAVASPARFLLGAIDSSMRGFVYEPGGWEGDVAEIAGRNSIPTMAIRADPRDRSAWESETLAAIDELLFGRGSDV